MAGLPEIFTKKLGPLPVWGWMGVGTAGMLAIGQGSKGKKTQTPAATPQPASDTQDPANAMGGFAGGGSGSQWTSGGNGQYGHTGYPGFGNGWTRKAGHLSSSPPEHGIRHSSRGTPGSGSGGHSGGWGGHQAGSGMHGIGGGSQGVGGIGHPHGKGGK